MNAEEVLSWIESHLGNVTINKVADSNLYEAQIISKDPKKTYRASLWVNCEPELSVGFGATMTEALTNMVTNYPTRDL